MKKSENHHSEPNTPNNSQDNKKRTGDFSDAVFEEEILKNAEKYTISNLEKKEKIELIFRIFTIKNGSSEDTATMTNYDQGTTGNSIDQKEPPRAHTGQLGIYIYIFIHMYISLYICHVYIYTHNQGSWARATRKVGGPIVEPIPLAILGHHLDVFFDI